MDHEYQSDIGSDADLDARMKAAGMMPLSDMLRHVPAGRWLTHSGVTDLPSFEAWLKMRRAEMLMMQASMALDTQQDDALFEWVVAHAAVFTEVLCNFQAARGRSPVTLD